MIKLPLSMAIKKKQYVNLFIIIFLCMLVLLAMQYLHSKKHPIAVVKDSPTTVNFASPLENVDTQAAWRDDMQKQLKQIQREKKLSDRVLEESKQQQQIINEKLKAQAVSAEEKYAALQKSIAQRQMTSAETIPAPNIAVGQGNFLPPAPGQGKSENPNPLTEYQIKEDKIELAQIKEESAPHKRPDNYVSSGSYATAVLLGGADASAGAMNQANPDPVVLRIITDGVLPNNKRSHLRGCVVTAAVIGDISAERGSIRLERLSCTKDSGQIIDIAVKGTLFGHDGKNGVRGHPVWREGPLIARAGVAGLFQGLGKGLEAKNTPQAAFVSSGMQFPSNQQLLGRSMGSGLNSAFDKIADYNIKRAEQYHPIIQISAGQLVDVVFLQGFYIDGLGHSAEEYETKDSLQASASKENSSSLESDKALTRLSGNT